MLFLHIPSWEGESWKVGREHAFHIKARRLHDQDQVCLVDGRGKWQVGTLEQRQTVVALKESGFEPLPETKKCLVFGWSKPQTMDWIIEKAVELGMTDVMPVFSDYVGSYPTEDQINKRMARFHLIASSALCQCEGRYLPILHPPLPLKEWIKETSSFHWILLDPTGEAPTQLPKGDLGVLVGPEGGWSEKERALLLTKSVASWSLMDRILRVETAAIVGMSLMHMKGGLL